MEMKLKQHSFSPKLVVNSKDTDESKNYTNIACSVNGSG